MSRFNLSVILLLLAVALLSVALLLIGSVDVPFSSTVKILLGEDSGNPAWNFIIMESRVPLILTAALSGAALAVCGLLLQTFFANPLADPSILGVSSGASLGVASVLLVSGGLFGSAVFGYLATLAGALIGALLIMAVLIGISTVLKSSTMLLIVGILISYLASSAITLLNFFATQEGVHSFVIWGLGNFSGVTLTQMPFYASLIIIGLFCSMMLVKPLNALLLGERYAENLGVNIKFIRNSLLLLSCLLTAVVTAFCGPIGFIGLVVPHISRLLLHTSDHFRLLPVTVLLGAVVAMLCTLISVIPSENGLIPINAITPIIGVPIIIYVIVNRKRIFYFN